MTPIVSHTSPAWKPLFAARGPRSIPPVLLDQCMRVRISYFDQNESLRQFFPVSGTVGATDFHAATGEHHWRIVDLDRPLATPE